MKIVFITKYMDEFKTWLCLFFDKFYLIYINNMNLKLFEFTFDKIVYSND